MCIVKSNFKKWQKVVNCVNAYNYRHFCLGLLKKQKKNMLKQFILKNHFILFLKIDLSYSHASGGSSSSIIILLRLVTSKAWSY